MLTRTPPFPSQDTPLSGNLLINTEKTGNNTVAVLKFSVTGGTADVTPSATANVTVGVAGSIVLDVDG